MVADLVTPSVEQHYIMKFLVKEKVKPEICHKLNAQYGEKTLTCASVTDTASFLKPVKKP
jgi:hypothetical protein